MSEPASHPAMPAAGSPRRTGRSVLYAAREHLHPIGVGLGDAGGVDRAADCRPCGAHHARTGTRCPRCGHRPGRARRNSFDSVRNRPAFWVAAMAGGGRCVALTSPVWLDGGRLPGI